MVPASQTHLRKLLKGMCGKHLAQTLNIVGAQ